MTNANSNRLSAYERANILSEIYYKVKAGRQIMEAIFNNWKSGKSINVSPLSAVERENFKLFYSNEYHAQPWDSRQKKMSDEIHTYLHELHYLWQRVSNQDFSQEEVMEKMGQSIYMDRDLINLYFEAHREAHPETSFWENVPTIVEEASKWQLLHEENNQQPDTDRPDIRSPQEGTIVEDNHIHEPAFAGQVRGDKIAGDKVGGDKIGIQVQGDAKIGKELRDEQYETALNWDGQRRMRGYDLAGRDLSGLNLANSDLRQANLQGADLSGSDLSGADLSGTKLRGAKLAESDLSRAILNGANMEDTNLWNARLIETQLQRIILDHANLADANLIKAEIVGRSLHGAILRRANLRKAKVIAVVINADLSDAELQGADLSEVPDLWRVLSLAGARYDEDTKWPDGFNPKAQGAILVDDDNLPTKDPDELDTPNPT